MAAPSYQAAGTLVTGNGSSVTPAWPTHQANDVGLLVIQTANEAVTLSGAAAADWTEIPDSPQGTGTANNALSTRLTMYWARASGASMGAPSVDDASNIVMARIFTVRGCITTGNPYDVTAGDVEAGTTTTDVAIPGDTTTVDECLVVLVVAHGIDGTPTDPVSSWSNGDLSSLTERVDDQTALAKGGGFAVATGELASAGAYGATTASLESAHTQGRISIALKPPTVAASGIVVVTASGDIQ